MAPDIPAEALELLRQGNPWWEKRPGRPVPPYHRWPFHFLEHRLEAPLAPAIVLRGPRQVGKTTLQEQLIYRLLTTGKAGGREIFRVQFDDLPSLRKIPEPILVLSRWFEGTVLGRSFNEAAEAKRPAYLFFDEVQNLRDWGVQVKALVDLNAVKVVVTRSSALRLQLGKDSLAGRLSPLEMGPLLLREVAGLRGLGNLNPVLPLDGPEPLGIRGTWEAVRDSGERNREIRDAAFRMYDERGAYPLAQDHPEARWDEVATQLNESIVRRAIQHDLRLGERGRRRDERLLGEVFRLACRYAGQAPNPATLAQEIRETLPGDVGVQRVRHYLEFLDSTLLIKLVSPLEIRLKRAKGFPKICLCDPALRASWLQERVPLSSEALDENPALSTLAGHIAESIVGYFLGGVPGLDLAWSAERAQDPEVDYVVSVGTHRIPLEVKYTRQIDAARDTRGLLRFMDRKVNNAAFGILVTRDFVSPPELDPRIVSIPMSSLLLMR
jgi:predicted AAA+ superfamily ATPase